MVDNDQLSSNCSTSFPNQQYLQITETELKLEYSLNQQGIPTKGISSILKSLNNVRFHTTITETQ